MILSPNKSVEFIKAIFADERFDLIQIGDYSIDRNTLINVTSEPVGEDERILIETSEYRMHIFASQIDHIVQAKESSRATFADMMKDERVDAITIRYDNDNGLPDVVIRPGDVMSSRANERNHLATLIETDHEIIEIRWAMVASIGATKKPGRR